MVLIKPHLPLKLCVCEIWFWSVERSWVERLMGSSFSEAFIAFFFANRTHRDRETHRESDKERRVCERRDFSLIQREIEEIVKYTINERERERGGFRREFWSVVDTVAEV